MSVDIESCWMSQRDYVSSPHVRQHCISEPHDLPRPRFLGRCFRMSPAILALIKVLINLALGSTKSLTRESPSLLHGRRSSQGMLAQCHARPLREARLLSTTRTLSILCTLYD